MEIKTVIPEYLKHLKALNRSPYTIAGIKTSLNNFKRFLDQEKAFDLESLTAELLEEYQQDLAFSLTAKGTLFSIATQIQILCNVRDFTAFLKEWDYLYHDPGRRIKVPKQARRLPKVILDHQEIKQLLKGPDTQNNRGYRNRLILELLYDTAIRRIEVSRIKLMDLELKSGFIKILGKSNKERVVPVNERVCQMIRDYLLFIRPAFIKDPEHDPGTLFLNRWGSPLEVNGVWAVVKRCVKQSRIKKNISTHTLRHTCATHMLRNGAPIRHIQEFLGHESLESTQIYTHVTINDLKEVHAKYHPSEKDVKSKT